MRSDSRVKRDMFKREGGLGKRDKRDTETKHAMLGGISRETTGDENLTSKTRQIMFICRQ